MAVIASGTITPTTVGTEEQITSQTTAGYFHAAIDISNLASGETVEVTIRKKVLSTDTIAVGSVAGTVHKEVFSYDDSQSIPVRELPPIHSEHQYLLSINQLSGTARAFKWSVDSP